ncbi:ComF family protein [Aureimonas jatrophae]|uniref:ComF family protein n=1 Tax=Aureimonas jatrophae TaxID=1166073 RepID=A0A1H0I9F2_9HYPH|nr:ComF family protein [Aureimonas jatrophae]MBB3952049.1 ComF family protein [Aureimonas jatrophae]SDO27890.1 comF family protein [Aureimonas jatrophae]
MTTRQERGAVRQLRRFGDALLSLVYPPVCAGCTSAVSRSPAVCAACWRDLRFLERPFCEVLGLPFAVDPGAGLVSPEAIANPPPFARLRGTVLYQGLGSRLVASLKYGDRTDLVPLMAGWMGRAGAELLAEADLVMPVPLHARRLLRRRFNQSAELGRHLARTHGRRFEPMMLRRVRATRSQVGLSASERERNLRGAFVLDPHRVADLKGRRVLLVDDVFTTGATVSAAARTLLRGGAAAVDVLVFARVAAGGS